MIFCISIGIHDVIMCAKFSEDRLRDVMGWREVKFQASPLTSVVHPYNTLTHIVREGLSGLRGSMRSIES